MNEILAFIMKYCSDLYNKYEFKFVDSNVSDSFGNCVLVLESSILKLQFIRDRMELFLDFQSKFDAKKKWYSMELIRQLITNETEYYSQLNDDNGVFLNKNLSK